MRGYRRWDQVLPPERCVGPGPSRSPSGLAGPEKDAVSRRACRSGVGCRPELWPAALGWSRLCLFLESGRALAGPAGLVYVGVFVEICEL